MIKFKPGHELGAVQQAFAGFVRRLMTDIPAARVARLETRLHGPSAPDDLVAAERDGGNLAVAANPVARL
jgi:hypothetical protein